MDYDRLDAARAIYEQNYDPENREMRRRRLRYNQPLPDEATWHRNPSAENMEWRDSVPVHDVDPPAPGNTIAEVDPRLLALQQLFQQET